MEHTYSTIDDGIYESIDSIDGYTSFQYMARDKRQLCETVNKLTLTSKQLNPPLPVGSPQQEEISTPLTIASHVVTRTQLNEKKRGGQSGGKSILILAPIDKEGQVPAEKDTYDSKTAIIINWSYEELQKKLSTPNPHLKAEPIDPNLAQSMVFSSKNKESTPEHMQVNPNFRSMLLLEREKLMEEADQQNSTILPNSIRHCTCTSLPNDTNEGPIVMETNLANSVPLHTNPTINEYTPNWNEVDKGNR